MGRANDHMMELENDRMRQWMMDAYGIDKDELDEDSEEWQEMAQEYQAECRLKSKGLQHPIGFVH